jgi:hypothetical protein
MRGLLMSEISPDGGAVTGTAPTASRTTGGRSATVSPAQDGPLTAPEPQVARARPDSGAASSMNQDITRALADVRLARLAAEDCLGPETSTVVTHDVELAEWRLNRLLERRQAALQAAGQVTAPPC